MSLEAAVDHSLKKGEVFRCYDDFKKTLDNYSKQTNSIFVIKNGNTIQNYNLKRTKSLEAEFPLDLKYKTVSFTCKHQGPPRTKGKGIKKHSSFKTGCECCIRLCANKEKNGLVITSINLHHSNHSSIESKKDYFKYPENRRLSPEAVQDIYDQLTSKVKVGLIKKHIFSKYGVKLRKYDIHNYYRKKRKAETTPDSADGSKSVENTEIMRKKPSSGNGKDIVNVSQKSFHDPENQQPHDHEHTSMMSFLSSIGLSQLVSIFEKEAITLDILREMSHNDLKDIGIIAFGHRHSILKGISPKEKTSVLPTASTLPTTSTALMKEKFLRSVEFLHAAEFLEPEKKKQKLDKESKAISNLLESCEKYNRCLDLVLGIKSMIISMCRQSDFSSWIKVTGTLKFKFDLNEILSCNTNELIVPDVFLSNNKSFSNETLVDESVKKPIPDQSLSSRVPSMSIIPSLSSTVPSSSLTVPLQSSKVLLSFSTVPLQSPRGPLPIYSSTVPLQASTGPLQSSTVLSPSSTVPLQSPRGPLPVYSSTVPLQASTVQLQSSTVPLQSSKVLSSFSTVPLKFSTVLSPSSPVPLQSSSVPLQSPGGPLQSSTTIPLQSSTIPLQSSTVPLKSSTVPLQSSTIKKIKERVLSRLGDESSYIQAGLIIKLKTPAEQHSSTHSLGQDCFTGDIASSEMSQSSSSFPTGAVETVSHKTQSCSSSAWYKAEQTSSFNQTTNKATVSKSSGIKTKNDTSSNETASITTIPVDSGSETMSNQHTIMDPVLNHLQMQTDSPSVLNQTVKLHKFATDSKTLTESDINPIQSANFASDSKVLTEHDCLFSQATNRTNVSNIFKVPPVSNCIFNGTANTMTGSEDSRLLKEKDRIKKEFECDEKFIPTDDLFIKKESNLIDDNDLPVLLNSVKKEPKL